MKEIDNEIKRREGLLDFSDVLSENGKKLIKKGQILGFKKNGVISHYKCVRVNKKSDIFQFKKMDYLFSGEEVEDIESGKRNIEDVINGKNPDTQAKKGS